MASKPGVFRLNTCLRIVLAASGGLHASNAPYGKVRIATTKFDTGDKQVVFLLGPWLNHAFDRWKDVGCFAQKLWWLSIKLPDLQSSNWHWQSLVTRGWMEPHGTGQLRHSWSCNLWQIALGTWWISDRPVPKAIVWERYQPDSLPHKATHHQCHFFFQLQNKRPRQKHCNAQAKMGWTGNIISTPFQELIAVCTRFMVDLRVLWVPNSGFNKSWLPELELLNSRGFVAPSGTGMLWVILSVVPRLPFCAATSTNPIPTNTPCKWAPGSEPSRRQRMESQFWQRARVMNAAG